MIPAIQFTDTGLVVPTTAEINAGVWDILARALGSEISRSETSPQGQLATSLTAAFSAVFDSMVEQANNFDPRYASWKYQDALAAIYFLTRKQAIPSVAALSVVGVAGTVIPNGWVIVDESGVEWATNKSWVVGPDLVQVYCSVVGPIQAAPGTINTPKVAIDGIDRASNPNAAAAGSLAESRASFEDRRYESVAANAKNMNEAVLGSVSNLTGVIDCFVVDNPTDETIQIGTTNYSMIRNSLLVSVVGGADYDIAGQIMIKGGTGCSFMGNTTVVWEDPGSSATYPPKYNVKFLRPNHVTTYMRLVVIDPASISYANSEAAKQQIIASFQSGANRARIGGILVGSNYLCDLNKQSIQPVKLELSTDKVSWSEFIRFGVDQYPVTSAFNIEIVGI